jgi:hypothetical protein
VFYTYDGCDFGVLRWGFVMRNLLFACVAVEFGFVCIFEQVVRLSRVFHCGVYFASGV